MAVDPHAQIAVNGAGVFAVVDGQLVRYDHGLHRLGAVDRKIVFQARSGPASTERARSVTATAERVFAGFDNGLVAEIDPHTLAPRMLVVMATPPTWLHVYRDRLLVTGEYGLVAIALANPDDSRGLVLPRPDIPYRSAPTTYLLDGDTLWFGLDGGEWGGGFGMYDLATQRSCVTRTEHGVYGFARAGDRVLVHGGVVHMGLHAGYVAAAAGCTLEPRWTGDTPRSSRSSRTAMASASSSGTTSTTSRRTSRGSGGSARCRRRPARAGRTRWVVIRGSPACSRCRTCW